MPAGITSASSLFMTYVGGQWSRVIAARRQRRSRRRVLLRWWRRGQRRGRHVLTTVVVRRWGASTRPSRFTSSFLMTMLRRIYDNCERGGRSGPSSATRSAVLEYRRRPRNEQDAGHRQQRSPREKPPPAAMAASPCPAASSAMPHKNQASASLASNSSALVRYRSVSASAPRS
jgi:hypothetical protein